MGYEQVNFIYLSEILGLPVLLADGSRIGRIIDLAATPSQVYPKVTGLIASTNGQRSPIYIPWNTVKRSTFHKSISLDYTPGPESSISKAAETEILLGKTFLDKQIISTSGYKLVRVNDLQLLIDNTSKENPSLWLVHIDIGVKGLLRRLGWGRWVNAVFKWIVARDMKDVFVSWKNVQPTSTTSVSGSLHLKTDSSKLEEIHPADLADILEDLGTDERISLLESLDASAAALTFQEMPLKLRLQICENLETEKLLPIIHEMQMDELVDLLDELPPDRRNALFQKMPSEKVAEIKELSKLSAHGVGSIMNTDFITARAPQTAGEVLRIVQSEAPKAEVLYYIYILDDVDRLKGIVTLRHLLTADPATPVRDIMHENVISVEIETSLKHVARLFFKYNFEAIPVVDDGNKIQGIVTLRDTLESVFPEVREESKG